MEKIIIDGVNIFNPIEGKLGKIIEYFVEFYGEEYRSRIENRLKNAIYIFSGRIDPNTLKAVKVQAQQYYNNKIKKYEFKLFNKLNLPVERFFYIRDYNFDKVFKTILEYKKGNINVNDVEQDIANNIVNLAYAFGIVDCQKPMTEDNLYKTLNIILSKHLLKFFQSYKELKLLWYDKYKKEVDSIKIQSKVITDKIGKMESQGIESYLNYKKKKASIVLLLFSKIIKKGVNELIKDKNINLYVNLYLDFIEKNEMFFTVKDKQNYIKLFKFLGFDFGNDFDKYINSKSLMKKLQDDSILEVFDNLDDMFVFEQTHGNCYLDTVIKTLLKEGYNVLELNLLDEVYSYVTKNNGGFAWVYPLRKISDKQIYNICICDQFLNLDTSTLIHEMNHIVESDLIFNEEKYMGYKYGFCYVSKNRITKNSCMLDEIVNDYITEKIYSLFVRDGFEIGAKNPKSSLYSKFFNLMGDFIDDNLSLIIKCRLSSDPYAFEKAIGRDNFNLLNDSINYFSAIGIEYLERAYKEIKKYNSSNMIFAPDYVQVLNDSINAVKRVNKNIKKKKKHQKTYLVKTSDSALQK